jgi:thioredoxin-dependent peroxiredoxin
MMSETTLHTGSKAPDFTLNNQAGQPVQLSRVLQQQPVVLFFYPRNNTMVCTQEACLFRDEYAAFQHYAVKLLGISADTGDSHQDFARQHGLPFDLLSDPGGSIAAQYHVKKWLGVLPGRVTFVIDRQQVIQARHASAFSATSHVQAALRVLASGVCS